MLPLCLHPAPLKMESGDPGFPFLLSIFLFVGKTRQRELSDVFPFSHSDVSLSPCACLCFALPDGCGNSAGPCNKKIFLTVEMGIPLWFRENGYIVD